MVRWGILSCPDCVRVFEIGFHRLHRARATGISAVAPMERPQRVAVPSIRRLDAPLHCRPFFARPADETPPNMANIFNQPHLKPSPRLIITPIMAILGRSELGSTLTPVLVTFTRQRGRPYSCSTCGSRIFMRLAEDNNGVGHGPLGTR